MHYEQTDTKKLNNLDEMDKFLETQNLLRITRKHKIWIGPVTSEETESVVKSLNKNPGSDGVFGELY